MGGITQVFCTFSKTRTDVVNTLVDTELLVPAYVAITEISTTGPRSPHTQESLNHIEWYMDEVIYTLHGEPKRQH